MSDLDQSSESKVIDHSTCLACGCLCDDIRVVVEGGRIVEAGHACEIGRPWFLAPRPGEGRPIATIEGKSVELALAIDRASAILGGAKAPIIWGLSNTTTEAVSSAVAIADRIGAVVDPSGSGDSGARLAAFQRVGQVSATLGEVKDRADVVVFWGVDPLATHPRHWERYSVEPRGRFVEGRPGRFVIVVDSKPSATSRAADLFVTLAHDRQGEALDILRALVRGVAVDTDRATEATGIPFPVLEKLTHRWKEARYGAFFFGASLDAGEIVESALKLVRDLNEGRRFVALDLGGPGNGPGAASVLTWQAGAPSSVDFSLGYPRHLPGEATLAARLRSDEVDAVLMVADAPETSLPPDILARLSNIPSIFIGPGATGFRPTSTVAFDVARLGIENGGTVARVDGLMLPPSARD